MTPTRPFRFKLNIKLISIIAAAVLGVGAIGAGTIAVLKITKPQVNFGTVKKATSGPAPTLSKGDQARTQAEKYFAENKLPEAKTAYQTAATAYEADNNTVAAMDAKQQIAMIDATIKATPTTSQAPAPKSSGNK